MARAGCEVHVIKYQIQRNIKFKVLHQTRRNFNNYNLSSVMFEVKQNESPKPKGLGSQIKILIINLFFKSFFRNSCLFVYIF